MKSALAALSLSLVLACSVPGGRDIPADIGPEQLLSGVALFGEPIGIDAVADPGILEVDEDMRRFVADQVGNAKSSRLKMRRLLSGMVESGLLSLDYNHRVTKTASETFHDRVGNCISFTNLFVALGREAGLDVRFQTVDIPPVWYGDSDFVVLDRHINALVQQKFESRVVVDFNVSEYKGNYDTRQVSDEYAKGLYYNNIAMDAFREGEAQQAFVYLKKAIAMDERIPGAWVNLGVLYSRGGLPEFAAAAYSRALDIDPRQRSALSNLANLYRAEGRLELADHYARRIRSYQEKNPYYHYYRARQAYDNAALDDALDLLRRAIRLKSNEHQFYSLRGLVNTRLGDHEAALASFTRARELTGFDSIRARYAHKIELLSRAGAGR